MFNTVTKFENEIALFFNAPYAVAIDSCTHGIELCLRLNNITKISVPVRTYLSIPMLANKLKIKLNWRDEQWDNFYNLNYDDKKIIDVVGTHYNPETEFEMEMYSEAIIYAKCALLN